MKKVFYLQNCVVNHVQVENRATIRVVFCFSVCYYHFFCVVGRWWLKRSGQKKVDG